MFVKRVFYHFLQAINKSIQDNRRWGGFVCANNPICSEVDPVFWLVKSLKPHNDDSQSGPWLTEEVRGTHQLLPMNHKDHKERISKKKLTNLWRNRIRKKLCRDKGVLSGPIMRKGVVDAETGGGAPPYSTFDDKVSSSWLSFKTETNGVSLAIVQT